MNIWTITLFFSLGIFLWEHYALTNDISLRPTYFIDKVTLVSQHIWRLAGVFWGYLGTCYEYLHIDKFHLTVMSFLTSFYNLVTSCKYFEYGFQSVALLYNHPNMIFACSIAITLSVALGTAKYFNLY